MPNGRIVVAALLALLVMAAPASARTVVKRAGPYSLGAFETVRPKVIVPPPSASGYITKMHARLVDRRGRQVRIQKVMLHHVVFINQGRFPGDRKPKCGARFGEPFYGTGEENEHMVLPRGYGYRTRPGDKWKMQTMLMSHSPKPRKVWVEYKMSVTKRKLQPVTPYWVRVTNCRNEPSYSVPGGGAPGSVHLKTRLWTPPSDGLIVAGGAHLHGGANDITLRDPGCRGRRLLGSDPGYGLPDDIAYNVKPVLHEPGPITTAWFQSRRGVVVRRGRSLRVTANYDATVAHPGVMGVFHIYIAEGAAARRRARSRGRCAPLPNDRREDKLPVPIREYPPKVRVPLTHLVGDTPTTLDHPAGPLRFFATPVDRPLVRVDDGVFKVPNLSVAAGTTITWSFDDWVPHKVSLANGPRSIGSPTLNLGKRYERQFDVPGVYQLFCYLHPMTMHQELTVRPGDDPTAPNPREGADAQGIEGQGDFY